MLTVGIIRVSSIICGLVLADIRHGSYMYWAGRGAAGAIHNGANDMSLIQHLEAQECDANSPIVDIIDIAADWFAEYRGLDEDMAYAEAQIFADRWAA